MSSEIAIALGGVSKSYRMFSEPQDRLKQALVPRLRRWVGLPPRSQPYYFEHWAIRDVSFEVARGEAVGVIGRNGSGKSTLLQIIAGTMPPTAGTVQVNGKVSALLELGAGFNAEFTGRENVYINGSILGLSKAEIDEKFEDIQAYADIGDFIDQPVKTYSSGMVVRLAFAVQVQLKPEILIVDEALSVGDMYFQAKCMATVRSLLDDGLTLLFVSHSLEAVKSLCTKGVFLEKGWLRALGPIDRVANAYAGASAAALAHASSPAHQTETFETSQYRSRTQPPFAKRIGERISNAGTEFRECCIVQDGREVDHVEHDTEVTVLAWITHHHDMPADGEVGLVLRTIYGLDLFAVNSYAQKQVYRRRRAGDKVLVSFRFRVLVGPGIYTISLGLKCPVQGDYCDKVFGAAVLRVEQSLRRPIHVLFRHEGEIQDKDLAL